MARLDVRDMTPEERRRMARLVDGRYRDALLAIYAEDDAITCELSPAGQARFFAALGLDEAEVGDDPEALARAWEGR